ncbi:hypothetical protein GCM10025868_38300 [Angustibacter aerolatus]|uniref:oxoglutarate dehydrogenase (succinyl-transferring) n=1 Tax=Angustibacter aerolatus TaxID=1162965 RepID=A0ABQ6JMV1_9ACTN|nr:thiamine pyrophosphate-dependent enzyme [Angustibacter aerolatus]GMA88580.1 hypothetical protein GCM10025868_38300 [Angustibacter aerolatus]
MVCYRRRGHNEGDDPSMTQPLMYRLIEAKRSVRKLYTESLIGRGDITVEDAEAALRDYQQQPGAGLHRDPRGHPRPGRAGRGRLPDDAGEAPRADRGRRPHRRPPVGDLPGGATAGR